MNAVFNDNELAEAAAMQAPPPTPLVTPAQDVIQRVTEQRAAAQPSAPQPSPQPVQRKTVLPEDMKPNIFICGPSGSGKSTSIENLDPERTIIISTEMKKLPFRGAKRFKMNTPVTDYWTFKKVFQHALQSDKADVIVVDSFTSMTEFVYRALVRSVEKVGDNVMSAWTKYGDEIQDILLLSKTSDKYVVFIGIDSEVQDNAQRITRSVDVQGRMRGKVEKEFVAVLYTKVIEADLATNSDAQYCFVTNSDGSIRAKSPKGLFDKLYIPNDLNAVINAMKAYYDEE